MNEPISKLFEDAQSACVEWDGAPLYGLYDFPAPSIFHVEILRSKQFPPQGLIFKAYGGTLRVNGVKSNEICIWANTAPNVVPFAFSNSKGRKAIIKVWNIWRINAGGLDTIQAWTGNSGIRIQEHSNKEILLRCSDGEGPVEFSDLEVRLILKH